MSRNVYIDFGGDNQNLSIQMGKTPSPSLGRLFSISYLVPAASRGLSSWVYMANTVSGPATRIVDVGYMCN